MPDATVAVAPVLPRQAAPPIQNDKAATLSSAPTMKERWQRELSLHNSSTSGHAPTAAATMESRPHATAPINIHRDIGCGTAGSLSMNRAHKKMTQKIQLVFR